jgi:peptidyl-prolyl cis-trans isomerase C
MKFVPLTLVFCALAGLGCKGEPTAVLAAGEGVEITADQFRASLNDESAAARGAYADPGKKRERLEKLIDFEVLVAEARRQGLERDPKILKATRELMVQRLLESRQTQQAPGQLPDEAAMKAQYEAQKDRPALAETVRVRHLFLASPLGADRSSRRQEAEKLRAQAASMPAGEEGDRQFSQLARAQSDEKSTSVEGGDLTHRTRDELTAFYSREVADGAFGLANPGQTTGVLESDKGLHLFRLVERTAARAATYEEFRASQAGQISRATRDEELKAYTNGLRSKARVIVREKELEQLNPLATDHRP